MQRLKAELFKFALQIAHHEIVTFQMYEATHYKAACISHHLLKQPIEQMMDEDVLGNE